MEVVDIDSLEPYINAILSLPPSQLLPLQLEPEDDSNISPVEVMLAVHVAVIKRMLGDPEGWDLSSFSPRQWRAVVDQLSRTEWLPCVACATPLGKSGEGSDLKLSQTLPGHYLLQHADWDGECPCIRLDSLALVMWVLPSHLF